MNTFLRTVVSAIFIASTILSPISPIIEKIGDNLFKEDISDSSMEIVDTETISSGNPTLDDQFTIPDVSNEPLTQIPAATPTPTTEPTPSPTEEDSLPEDSLPEDTLLIQEEPPVSNLELSSDKEYLVAGEQVILNINLKTLPEGAHIRINASEGLSPKEDQGKNYHSEQNSLDLSLQAQSVVWQTADDAKGPFFFNAQIIIDEEIVEEQVLSFDQAIIGKVTSQGGSVNWKDKGISIRMDKGAVDRDVDLIIRQAYVHPIAPYSLSGHSIILLAKDAEGKEISNFDSEVTLEIRYDPEEFTGNETAIFINYYDEENGDWVAVPTKRDLENHIVSATISHFSEWDLEAGSWEASRLPTLDNFDEQGFSGGVTFNYPIDLPAGPGSFSPQLNLSYNSASVDGINIHSQAGWAGMGWSMDVGSIIRNQHDTIDTTVDDTFTLTLDGIGGLLIQEETDPASNIVNYYLQNEDFLRVQYYKSEKAWIVWDKSGTRYVFGGELDHNGTLVNHDGSAAKYPTCSTTVANTPIWQWGLRQIVDSNNQKISVDWAKAHQTLANYCKDGYTRWLTLDLKPTTITYPNNGYRVLFTTTTNRRDYSSSWNNTSKVFFTQKNLDRINIQRYEGGQWITSWYYDLTYAQDLAALNSSYSNFIMPLHLWGSWTSPVEWRKTLTLVGVRKCYSEGVCDPEFSFEYGDGLHITAAENGQGGRVEYSYDVWYEENNVNYFASGDGPAPQLCSYSGAAGTYGWDNPTRPDLITCQTYSNEWYMWVRKWSYPAYLTIPETFTRPGSYYRFDMRASIAGHGDNYDWFKVGIGTSPESPIQELFSGIWSPTDTVLFIQNPPETTHYPTKALIRSNGEESCGGRTCDGCAILIATVRPVTTIYYLEQKIVIDQTSGDEYSYTYTYDEFATNDPKHSETVENSSYHCGFDSADGLDDNAICYSRIFGHSRGNSASTVTDPSGQTIINYFHQDDAKAGRNSASMTVVSQYGDNFENGLNTSQWTVSLSGGANDFGNVMRHYGDNALVLTEGESAEWSNVVGSTTTSPDGRSVIVQFMPQAGSEFTLGVQNSANPAYKWQITGSDSGISARYGDGSGIVTPNVLIPSGDYEANQWYVAVFTLDHDDGYSVRVWKRIDPSITGFFTMPAATGNFTSGMTWQFAGSVRNGTLYLDEYLEAYLFALTMNEYNVVDNPNSIVIDPPHYYRWAMADFPGFDVHWVSLAATESYLFEGGSAFQATRTEYAFADSPQYGNVTGISEQGWVNGTGFVDVRQTNIDYYPADSASTYIVSLPAQQSVYGCSGGICNQDLLSISRTYYDSNSYYTDSPSHGLATLVRQGVGKDASTIYWADTQIAYDSWGNQTSVTQYTSYGTDPARAVTGAQTTTTTYDAELHTYPVTVTPALSSHQITMTYDTLRGLPESMTDPNGLVTLLCYDNKARLIGSVKGDSANPPTCGSQMEIDITYHEATETGGVWSPFWTEASQVLSLDTLGVPDLEIAYRKFYDGIGRQIQTQTVGVDLDGYADGSQTIINDFFYNPNGLLEYSSMPYNVTTPAGFSAQPACTTSNCVSTIYDALGREIETQAPDGSVTQTTYGLDAAENLRSVTMSDTLQNSTTSWQDVWGQTMRVMPETGPWTEYAYNLAGQLIQVDQVNSTGVFASTYMAYDLGGRKLEMNDPDMGVWTYEYDALGNLTSQTDAKQQETNLCYDDMNRLTGKFYGSSGDCSTPAGWDVTYYYDAYNASIFSGYAGSTSNAIGQRTGMLDGSGQTIWSYNQRGNLIREDKLIGAESFTTEWAYSIGGLLEQMAYPLVNSTGETIFTTYTPQGGVASVGSLNNTYIGLTYDEAGRAVNRTYYTSDDGLQTNFDYYDWNEQVSSVPQGGLLESSQTGTLADPDSLASLAYIYDAVGNVASITDLVQSPAQVQSFGYDSLYRLTGATGSAGFGGTYAETYTYDDLGRMDSKAGSTLNYAATRTGTCQANALTPAASSTITHAVSSKSGGNSYTYDCNGNAITRGDQTLIYDEENRLVEVQVNSVTVAEYVYDGDGNQVKAIVTGGDLTIDTIFIGTYYQKTTTLDESVSPAVETTEWEKYYYAGSVRLAMREDTDDPLYLIGDHLGSTSLVLDSAGLEVAKQTYLPFGEDWGVSVTDLPTDYTFTGQREAAEIGLNYYVARWYDSYLNHFTQPDTIIADPYNPMAWNRYAYANYNPINYTDPTGHFAWIAVGAIIGAAISYGIQVYDNYENGMSGSEAWTDVSIAEIVGGAIIGASVVALAPVAVAAVGEGLIATGIATGSGALLGAGMATSAVATGMASVLYGPISGTVERVTDAASSVQQIISPPPCTNKNPFSLEGVDFLDRSSVPGHIFRDDYGHVMYETPEWRQQMRDTVSWDNFKQVNENGKMLFSRILEDHSEMWVEVYNNTIRDAGVNQEWLWHSIWGK